MDGEKGRPPPHTGGEEERGGSSDAQSQVWSRGAAAGPGGEAGLDLNRQKK